MKTRTTKQRQLLGGLLVGLQFVGMLLLAAMALPALAHGTLGLIPLVLGAASVALAVWILMHNRLGNFNIQPAPKAQGALVTSGPYRWIRHPMYSAVLLGGAGLALLSEPLPAWTCWVCLALVLRVKAALEERWMSEQHPLYAAYMLQSKRFIPWLL